jgi:hypothetical protein
MLYQQFYFEFSHDSFISKLLKGISLAALEAQLIEE